MSVTLGLAPARLRAATSGVDCHGVVGVIKIRRFSSETHLKSDVEMTDHCGRHYAPSVREPAHHPLDRMGFYGFGQRLKPEMWEKYRNPKNSKNTRTDATTADDCGVMSLGHSPCMVKVFRL